MTQIKCTFISLSENVTEQKGAKTYDFFKVRYVDEGGNQKVYSGFQNVLKFNRELGGQLRKLQQNDEIILVFGKNKAGYDELQAVSPVSGGNVRETRSTTASSNSGNSSVSAPARAYSGETPEERAKRQILIVKQSSLSSAVDTLKQDKKVPTVEEVLSVAQEYFDWVMSTDAKPKEQVATPAKPTTNQGGPTINLDDDIPF